MAGSSRTVWSILIAGFAMVGNGVKVAIDYVADLFGAAPDIATEMHGMVDPIKGVLSSLQVNAAQITTIVTVACLAVAIIRHVDLKGKK